jgi:hypothetical protein
MGKLIFTAILLVCAFAGFAQTGDAQQAAAPADSSKEKLTALQGKVDGIEESYLADKAAVAKLSKIKVSGYIQAEWRMALDTASMTMDSTGKYLQKIGDFAGGAFPDGMLNNFLIRRGRLKIGYETDLTKSYIQFDASTSGFEIKDCYFSVTEPWLKSIGLQAGIFNRPFGYEIEYSSSDRESPERSRAEQVLFPKERDLGAMLFLKPADNMGALNYFNLKAGLFNGTQANVAENDNHKDFIGRLGFSVPLMDLNLSIDGGVSTYLGTVTCTDTTQGLRSSVTTTTYDSTKYNWVNMYDSTTGTATWVRDYTPGKTTTTKTTVKARGMEYEMANNVFKKSDTTVSQLNKQFDRKYYGFDLQLYYDIPVIGGVKFLTDYYQGSQPGTSSSASYYNPGRNSGSAVYMRNFQGYYVMLVKNILAKNQLVLKYDVFDPNTDVSGDAFALNAAKTGFNGGLSVADLQYNTLGVGWIFHWDENLKFVLYLDHVTNEKVPAASGASSQALKLLADDYKDDVLTLRAQYKF